ncbi:MAG: hypothetical protein SFV17_18835, partial [Candidatus Obscuribacter sp.]|nr:hypothetical protein [Candidatus Obscuribacter sp.]
FTLSLLFCPTAEAKEFNNFVKMEVYSLNYRVHRDDGKRNLPNAVLSIKLTNLAKKTIVLGLSSGITSTGSKRNNIPFCPALYSVEKSWDGCAVVTSVDYQWADSPGHIVLQGHYDLTGGDISLRPHEATVIHVPIVTPYRAGKYTFDVTLDNTDLAFPDRNCQTPYSMTGGLAYLSCRVPITIPNQCSIVLLKDRPRATNADQVSEFLGF